jgi:hypothetical protein
MRFCPSFRGREAREMNRKQLGRVIEELGVEKVIDYEKNIQIPCLLAKWRPGHTSESDHSGSMGISVSRNGKPSLVNCFSCKFKGNLSYLLFKYEQLSKRTDLRNLRDWVDDIEEGDPIQMVLDLGLFGEKDEDAPVKHDVFCESILRMFFKEVEVPYLESRGIDLETLKVWGSLYDVSQNRVVFPVRRMTGENKYNCTGYQDLVGAIGRSVDLQYVVTPNTKQTRSVKYFNYFKFPKANYFFGEHLAKKNTVAVVVEGVMDAVLTWQALRNSGMLDEYSVLGLMGSSSSKVQERRLYEEFTSVVSFFDNDPAGWTGQRGLIIGIQDKTLLRGVRYPRSLGYAKSDPADLVKRGEDVAQMIRDARLIAV